MHLKDFSGFRAGSGWPWCLDVSKGDYHESHGVVAQCYTTAGSSAAPPIVELRRQGDRVALLTLAPGSDTPAAWVASDLLWSNAWTHPVQGDAPALP
jgi:hypothetical protein